MADAESVLHTLTKSSKNMINHEVKRGGQYKAKRHEFHTKYHQQVQNNLKKTPLEKYQAEKWADTLKHLVV
jgi:hypothetical protein